MINFVEYQRAIRSLRIAGIILGVLFLIAVVGRIAGGHFEGADSALSRLEKSPTAHVTRTTLPDGSTRTVVDDPAKNVHAVAVIRGDHYHIEIAQPSHGTSSNHIVAGNVSVNESSRGGMDHVVVDSQRIPGLPLGGFFMSSVVLGWLIASLLGGVLSKENDGHLELAWTKPVSRERYATSAFAIDVATILIAQLLWVGVALLAMLLFFVPHIQAEPGMGAHIAISLLAPIAFYAALNGWSASLKRGPGAVIGLGWLAALLVPGIAQATAGGGHPIVVAIHVVFQALSYLDPLAFSNMNIGHISMSSGAGMHLTATMTSNALALAALTLFYLAIAVVQWRRVEA